MLHISKGALPKRQQFSKNTFFNLLEVVFFVGLCTMQSFLLPSCSFLGDFFEIDEQTSSSEIHISQLKFNASSVSVKVGNMVYLSWTVSPSSASIKPKWDYDAEYISLAEQNNGVVITGVKEGQTSITASYQDKSATCIVTVSGYSETYAESISPYIYSDTTILQMNPGDTQNIHVSLYNGTAADIEGYTWTIEKSDVATLNQTGQYCSIVAKDTGYSRIKVTHTKATYPYYIGLYVLDDISKTTFITTKNNILSLNKQDGDKSISVSLTNPKTDDYNRKFSWTILEGDSATITANQQNCIVTPVKSGNTIIRVENDEAAYPLDITVRVIEIVENVYIEASPTLLTLSGSETKEITLSLNGTNDYSESDFTFESDDPEIFAYFNYGNKVSLSGLRNGSASLYVSHPYAKYARQVMVIVEGQTTSAVDSSCYITTSQNYIKTKVGAEETTVNIMLKGGSDGDEKDFTWEIRQTPNEQGKDVVSVTTTTGAVTNARAASATYAYGVAHISPLAEGTAVITLRHPKAYYTTEILVKVLNEGALLESPLYFSGSGIVKFLNSEQYTYTVSLLGSNKIAGDENNIAWESDNSAISIAASANQAVLSSTKSGSNISHITISHPKADNPKSVLVLTADTQEQLDSIKAFYSDKTYYSLNVGSKVNVYANHVGFDSYDADGNLTNDFDFTLATWTSSDPNIASVEKNTASPLNATITGNKAGSAKITVRYGTDASLTYDVTVYPADVNISTVETAKYLTTTQNVINIASPGNTKTATVSAIGIGSASYANIIWHSENEAVATVIGNGTSATITAAAEGESVLTVSHPDSENTLKIYVRVGSEYIIKSEPVVYISTNTDIITLVKDDPTYTLTAALVNAETADSQTGFSFSLDKSGIAEISAQYANGKCYLKPISAGQAELTVSHPASAFEKKILIVVGNTKEELAAFKYLTTTNNVVTIGIGNTKTISATMQNSATVVLDGYTWSSNAPEICSVNSYVGTDAIIQGNKAGTTRLTVTHTDCAYPLEIIVQVYDSTTAAAHPYIQVNSTVLTLLTSTSWTNLSATLVGGTDNDALNFQWECDNTSVLQCYGQNGTGKIRAVAAGEAYITVSHPKAEFEQRILVICDEATSANCSISVSSGNIMSIKPNAGDKTITASLINGDETDKYNFTWSLDVYDIVSLDYNANTAIITPMKEGSCTLTVHHPKSAYDQKIIIKVQQYENFGFGTNSMKVTEGKTTFLNMQVPASSVATHVKYSTNAANIVRIAGTDAVCQLTGIGSGTATVHAELIATNTNAVQAEADLLVYVEEASTVDTYITGSTTIYKIEKGKTSTLSASLVGVDVTTTDNNNLEWISSNPAVIAISGANTSTGVYVGRECYVTAKDGGECTITIMHDKASSPLVYHMIVPTSETQEVSLNKSYVKLTQGNTVDIRATIKNGSNADYKELQWEIDKPNGVEVARIMGTGQTIALYAINPGTTHVRATVTASGDVAECEVIVESQRTLTLSTNTIKVQPTKSVTVNYTISPDTATIDWQKQTADGDEFIEIDDNGNANGKGSITINGIKEGKTTVRGISSYGSVATFTVNCAWDYKFTVSTSKIAGSPEKEYPIEYYVSPADAAVEIICGRDNEICEYSHAKADTDGNGKVVVLPRYVGSDTVTLRARNPNDGNKVIGEQKVTANFYYDSLSVNMSVESDVSHADNTKVAYWSKVDNDAIKVGDGEDVRFLLSVENKKIKVTGLTATLTNNSLGGVLSLEQGGGGRLTLRHANDITEPAYKITEGYRPTLNGSTSYPDGKPIRPEDFEMTFGRNSTKDSVWGHDDWVFARVTNTKTDYEAWRFSTYPGDVDNSSYDVKCVNGSEDILVENHGVYSPWAKVTIGGVDYSAKSYSGQRSDAKWGRERDTSLDGKYFKVEEFEKILWYYCPKFDYRDCSCTIKHSAGEIDCTNISANYLEITDDTSIVNEVNAATLEVTITHTGGTEIKKFLVYVQTRNCACTTQK